MKIANPQLTLTALLLCGVFFLLDVDDAQSQSRLSYTAETGFLAGSADTTAFWLRSNRRGTIADDQVQGFLSLSARYHTQTRFDGLSVDVEAELFTRPTGTNTAFFPELYAQLNYHNAFLMAGRKSMSTGVMHPEMSSGSMGRSLNATPPFMVMAGLREWTALPGSFGYIHLRGHVAHGWLEENRYTASPLYHEKIGHARFGGSLPVNLYGGIQHFVLWGGNSPVHGQMPAKFSDFWRVFFALGGDDEAPPGDQDYMLGDHLGAWDFGLIANAWGYEFKVYRQFPLETKDNLKLKSPQDALMGFSLNSNRRQVISGFLYEYIYSKFQDGPRRSDPDGTRDGAKGDENYYNHSLYRTGWASYGRTIGTPLFFPRQETPGIANNRVVGHHAGISGSFGDTNFMLMGTFTRNYGTRRFGFDPYLPQFSGLVEVDTPLNFLNEQLRARVALAIDRGDVWQDQVGGMVTIRWESR